MEFFEKLKIEKMVSPHKPYFYDSKFRIWH
ncbi:hypothetical protein BC792_11055 [Sphingobacterium allocomposti]|uniref:Uncharacterized protein n=1 Tax=Sphingobacterium allocomposti TaxID=415956 RepID=A0A5S5DK31_9SPHI|nr:hypothetical protein BC792_11055 [Sphingobacterium composti Yoo et al. 2007 non Ten et al. 2007]